MSNRHKPKYFGKTGTYNKGKGTKAALLLLHYTETAAALNYITQVATRYVKCHDNTVIRVSTTPAMTRESGARIESGLEPVVVVVVGMSVVVLSSNSSSGV